MTPGQQQEVETRLNAGQAARALDLAQSLAGAAPDDRLARLYRGIALRAVGRHADALADLKETERLCDIASDRQVAADAGYWQGVVHADWADWHSALACFERSAALSPPNADRCAGLCQALCRVGRYAEALPWRMRAIELRDRDARVDATGTVPRRRPNPFDRTATTRNIVAYSLFGADRFYHECAVTIARTTPIMFPEFTARFYCASDLPKPVVRAIASAGAEVLVVEAGGASASSPFAGLFWRFLPFDDPGVDVVLVRDVDSPILMRERAAIDLWLESDAPFYCLRDHPIHAEPMLAGMWGGFTGLLPRISRLAATFAQADRSRYADQRFLRQIVWPRIRDATLSIDSCGQFRSSVDFPPAYPKFGRMHVGMNWSRDQILGAA